MTPPPPPSPTTGLVLLSHGSKDPIWRGNAEHLLCLVQQMHPQAAVACAYLEWCQPDLHSAIQTLVHQHASLHQVTIWPLLFGMGKHAREDIPARVQQLVPLFPQLTLQTAPAMGEHPHVMALLAGIAGDYLVP